MLITLARKPPQGSVVQNALQHGCGALNVDATRIGYAANEPDSGANFYRNRGLAMPENRTNYFRGQDGVVKSVPSIVGRWPANVILFGDAVEAIDAQGGDLGHSFRTSRNHQGGLLAWKAGNGIGYGDTGGASRFFKQVRRQPDGFPSQALSQDKRIGGNDGQA